MLDGVGLRQSPPVVSVGDGMEPERATAADRLGQRHAPNRCRRFATSTGNSGSEWAALPRLQTISAPPCSVAMCTGVTGSADGGLVPRTGRRATWIMSFKPNAPVTELTDSKGRTWRVADMTGTGEFDRIVPMGSPVRSCVDSALTARDPGGVKRGGPICGRSRAVPPPSCCGMRAPETLGA